MTRIPVPVIKIVQGDQLNRETIIVSSPHRFVEGGRAIFDKFVKSHNVAMRGIVAWAPRTNNRVRLWVRS